jgi:hypothetical protein
MRAKAYRVVFWRESAADGFQFRQLFLQQLAEAIEVKCVRPVFAVLVAPECFEGAFRYLPSSSEQNPC